MADFTSILLLLLGIYYPFLSFPLSFLPVHIDAAFLPSSHPKSRPLYFAQYYIPLISVKDCYFCRTWIWISIGISDPYLRGINNADPNALKSIYFKILCLHQEFLME